MRPLLPRSLQPEEMWGASRHLRLQTKPKCELSQENFQILAFYMVNLSNQTNCVKKTVFWLWVMSFRRVYLFPWKYLLVTKKKSCSNNGKCPNFSLRLCFQIKREESWSSLISSWKLGFFESPTRKLLLIHTFEFLENITSLSVKPISIKPLISIKAIYGQKTWKKSIPLPLAQYSIFLDYRVALKLGN